MYDSCATALSQFRGHLWRGLRHHLTGFIKEVTSLFIHRFGPDPLSALRKQPQLRLWRPSLLGCFLFAVSRQIHPRFIRHPNRTHEEIDWSSEKRRLVALNPLAEKQQRPAAQKHADTQEPFHQEEPDYARENHRYAHSVQQFIPGRRMLVVVLRHVVRRTCHSAPPSQGDIVRGNFTLQRNTRDC